MLQLTQNQINYLISSLPLDTVLRVNYTESESEVIDQQELNFIASMLSIANDFSTDEALLQLYTSDTLNESEFARIKQGLIDKQVIAMNNGMLIFLPVIKQIDYDFSSVLPTTDSLEIFTLPYPQYDLAAPMLIPVPDQSQSVFTQPVQQYPDWAHIHQLNHIFSKLTEILQSGGNSYDKLLTLLSLYNPQHAINISNNLEIELKQVSSQPGRSSAKKIKTDLALNPSKEKRIEANRISSAHSRSKHNFSREVISKLLEHIVHLLAETLKQPIEIPIQNLFLGIKSDLDIIIKYYNKDSRTNAYYGILMNMLNEYDSGTRNSLNGIHEPQNLSKPETHESETSLQSTRKEKNKRYAQRHRDHEKESALALYHILSRMQHDIIAAIKLIHADDEVVEQGVAAPQNTNTTFRDTALTIPTAPAAPTTTLYMDDYRLLTASQHGFFKQSDGQNTTTTTSIEQVLSTTPDIKPMPLPTTGFYDAFFQYNNPLTDAGLNRQFEEEQQSGQELAQDQMSSQFRGNYQS